MRLALALTSGVGAQPFGCDEAAVGSLATVTTAGARSRDEIKGFLTQMYARFWNDLADHASA